ncbi:hypothetical protein D3C71_1814190 [compost metagenome]
MQTLHMFTVAEYYRAFMGVIATNSFKYRRSVVQRMRHYVNLGIGPGNHLTIEPDIIGFLRHCVIPSAPSGADLL